MFTVATSSSDADVAMFDEPIDLLNEYLISVLVLIAKSCDRNEWRDERSVRDSAVKYRLHLVSLAIRGKTQEHYLIELKQLRRRECRQI